MVKKTIIKVITAYKKWLLKKELKSAIELAKERRYKTHKKHMVLWLDNKFQVYERTHLKELVFKGGVFKKGINIRHLEQAAYFITD